MTEPGPMDSDGLKRINQTLTGGISHQGVFQAILHEAVRLCEAERGFLLFDTNDVAAALNADRGDYSREVVQAVRQTKAALIRETQSGDRRATRHGLKTPRVRRSVIAAPLLSSQVLEGIIYLDTLLDQHTFTEQNLQKLASLAEQAVPAFQLAATKYAQEQKQAEIEYFSSMSGQDKLTGLASHRILQESLDSLFHDPLQLPASLIAFSIDDFDYYASRNGEAAEDELLKRLGLLLSSSLRAPDLAARYDTNIFTILLVKTALEDAQAVAERLRLSISKTSFPFASFQPAGHLSISLGVTCAPEQAKNPDTLLQKAQAALDDARAKGKNQVACAPS